MSKVKKLRSPKGIIRVALTSGHVLNLTESPREVEEIFWSEAYALGAISGDMENKTLKEKVELAEAEADEKAKKEALELREMLTGLFENPRGTLDSNNNPLTRKVSAILGRNVKKHEVLSVWEELKELKG